MNGNWRREDEEDGQYLGKRTYIIYHMRNLDIPREDAQNRDPCRTTISRKIN